MPYGVWFLSGVASRIEHMFEVEGAGVLEGLDSMPPGAGLAGLLDSVDVRGLSGYDRVVLLQALQRLVSHYQARLYEAMAAIVEFLEVEGEEEDDAEGVWLAAGAEIRAALCLTRRTADAELSMAWHLQERLPCLGEALAAGDIDLRRARVTADGTAHLPEPTARQVVAQILEEASSLTTGQLRALVRRLCLEADSEEAERRYEQALSERRVITEPTTSGTAHLYGLELSPHRVAAVTRRINLLARSLKHSGESRSMDQLRADVFLDLLHGTATASKAPEGTVDIYVDEETLAGLADRPGEIPGFGPVIADIARQVATQQARWQFTVTNQGQPLHVGVTRRRPTATQQRAVQALHRTCVFPGCRMPAQDCDLDHRIPWAEGGATTIRQLVPLCRHDHQIRHRCGWTHQQLPDRIQWTSKLGHTYTTRSRSP